MTRLDRVLHFVTTRPLPESTGEPSVQGWQDAAPGWPALHRPSRFVGFFPSPASALARVEVAFELLERLRDAPATTSTDLAGDLERAAGAWVMPLEALVLPPGEVALRKGTYGQLARRLGAQLARRPELVRRPGVAGVLGALAESLEVCGDPDLVREGHYLRAVARRARRRARRVRAPGPEGATVTFAGGTAPARTEGENVLSFSEVFEAPRELDADGAYRLLVEECLADGVVSRAETASLLGLARLLGIRPARRRRLEDEATTGRDVDAGEFDRARWFLRLVEAAAADGRISGAEDRLLGTVASFLCLTREELERPRRRAASLVASRGGAPGRVRQAAHCIRLRRIAEDTVRLVPTSARGARGGRGG